MAIAAGSEVKLLGMDRNEMERFVESIGEPRYRVEQIMRWIYGRGAATADDMSDLPKSVRERIRGGLRRLETVQVQLARDGVCKLLLRLEDGHTVEAVSIPDGKRRTACISSQAGCGIGCTFCATALGGFQRNLRAGEIVDQLTQLERASGAKATNVVFMGMGEPFANYGQVIKAARLLNDPWGMGIGARHITISTSGVVPAIERFTEEGLQFVLAVSLHAGTNAVRDRLVPLNRKYPIEQLMEACRRYAGRTGRRVTFEYVMIDGVNDGIDQADAVIRATRGLLCHINLIPLNAVPETGYRRSPGAAIDAFADRLRRGGLKATIRRERGADIEAACGQLRRSIPAGS